MQLVVRNSLTGHFFGHAMEAEIGKVLRGLGFQESDWEKPCEQCSGGWQMRIALAKLLLQRPNLLLLDEPSTGLDPGARRDVWQYLEEVRTNEGVTSFLTTHLMEEAEKCDRLGLLDEGKLIAVGTPDELKARIGGDIVSVEAHDPDAFAAAVLDKFGLEGRVVENTIHFEKDEGESESS